MKFKRDGTDLDIIIDILNNPRLSLTDRKVIEDIGYAFSRFYPLIKRPIICDSLTYNIERISGTALLISLIKSIDKRPGMYSFNMMIGVKFQQVVKSLGLGLTISAYSALKTLIEINAGLVSNTNDGFFKTDLLSMKTNKNKHVAMIKENCPELSDLYAKLATILNSKSNIVMYIADYPESLGVSIKPNLFNNEVSEALSQIIPSFEEVLYRIIGEKSKTAPLRLKKISNVLFDGYREFKDLPVLSMKYNENKEFINFIDRKHGGKDSIYYIPQPRINNIADIDLKFVDEHTKIMLMASTCYDIICHEVEVRKEVGYFLNHLNDLRLILSEYMPDLATNFYYLRELCKRNDVPFHSNVSFNNINALRHFDHKKVPILETYDGTKHGDRGFSNDLQDDCSKILNDIYKQVIKPYI